MFVNLTGAEVKKVDMSLAVVTLVIWMCFFSGMIENWFCENTLLIMTNYVSSSVFFSTTLSQQCSALFSVRARVTFAKESLKLQNNSNYCFELSKSAFYCVIYFLKIHIVLLLRNNSSSWEISFFLLSGVRIQEKIIL